MGNIFILMGKSSVGKDTIYTEILKKKNINPVVPYTTRPIRIGERDGREYYFIDEEKYRNFKRKNKIIESRSYDTVYGIWRYMTIDDGQFSDEKKNYLMIGTLESFQRLQQYFGNQRVVPIYINLNDRERLLRSIARESRQENPGYMEVCRRFIEDEKDFSEEKLKKAGINKFFENIELENTVDEIIKYMENINCGK